MNSKNATTKLDSELLGERLRFLRTSKANMSQSQIAKLLNIERSTYSGYELGIFQPDIWTIKKIAKIYEVSINPLLDNERNNLNQ